MTDAAEAVTPDAVDEANVGTKPVEEKHRFDVARLERWLAANVEGFSGPLEVAQFKGGQSNPTYQLITPRQKYVLRRKPPGKLLPSAHAVDREFRVISALNKIDFPVARAYALCTDEDVIGTMFYVMSMVEGRVIWNGQVPGVSREERRAIYKDQIDTLAALHTADYQALGLEGFGKPGNYFKRQIDRWTKQYYASETQKNPEFDELAAWLPATAPEDTVTSIVHGDYRIDNMIYHADRPKVAAVLDWELSTLGNPLADFSYLLMNWAMPSDQRSGLRDVDLEALGIPTVPEVVERYAAKTGRGDLGNVDWLFSYNLYRLAAICQGIVGRVRDGTANHPGAVAMEARVPVLAGWSYEFAKKAGL
jgi:aminoglycoside phosphotransferase (APT) family kinase protein